MPNDQEYIAALNKAIDDLEQRVYKRDLINAEIAGLKETVRVLSSRVRLREEGQRRIAQLLAAADYATPNLKDAIRSLLIRNGWPMTAVDVRNALEESGFNFDDFSNPLSACHATLKRMEDIETGTSKDGKATYKIDLKIARPSGGHLRSLIGLTGKVEVTHEPLTGLMVPREETAIEKLRRTRKTIGQRIAEGGKEEK